MTQYDPEALLQRIARLQSVGDAYFPAGLFPAYRHNPNWAYRRPDTNVFFTAVTVFTLQQLRPRLSVTAQLLVDQITERALPTYDLFRNKDGLKTYNFYQTKPSRHFPHGWLMRHFDHFRIPDDIDDTAMVYLTSRPAPDDLRFLVEKLPQHANGTRLLVRNTFPEYQTLRVYSTWFGKNMNIEFDACALSNLLYCLYEYDMPPSRYDADSLTFLRAIVESDRYRTDPFRCAHNYARTSLIIYHLSRLIGAFNPPALQPILGKLYRDTQQAFETVTNRLDRILLATSLLRLGPLVGCSEQPDVPLAGIGRDFERFHFFIAGMLSAYEHRWVYSWAPHPFWHIRWQCEAHNWALVLEYVCLRNGGPNGSVRTQDGDTAGAQTSL